MIAWLTHHLPRTTEEPGIPGLYRGGAEMSDAAYLQAAPEEVKLYGPDQWREAIQHEKVIVTGTDLLTDEAMLELCKVKPVVMVHHKQTRSLARQELINNCRKFIARTPRHLEIELQWTSPKATAWVVSSFNPDDFVAKPKENFAVWAARLHQQKGPLEAMVWASQAEIPLLMLYDKPRETVLEAMSRAKHFVFLPTDFDSESRVTIEAVLSGCEPHVNEHVGITSVSGWNDRDKLAELVSNSAKKFWEEALN